MKVYKLLNICKTIKVIANMTPLHREHFQRRKHENKLHTDAEAESRRTTGCVQNNESGFP